MLRQESTGASSLHHPCQDFSALPHLWLSPPPSWLPGGPVALTGGSQLGGRHGHRLHPPRHRQSNRHQSFHGLGEICHLGDHENVSFLSVSIWFMQSIIDNYATLFFFLIISNYTKLLQYLPRLCKSSKTIDKSPNFA